ncbi:MAG: hypothetical protein LJE91_14430 [Gammaproteobacteria bacterium]|nr:hypothetical protein [Gammaproteobacteria bacterium]
MDDERTLRYELSRHFGDQRRELEFLPKPLVSRDLHVAISQAHPDHEDMSFRTHEATEGDDRLRVTAAVLTSEEAQEAFGVDLRSRWIQTVWLKVTNQELQDVE